jgi:hypothetical protein
MKLVMAQSLSLEILAQTPVCKKPHRQSSATALRLLVRLPGRHSTPQITFHVQKFCSHRPRKRDDSRATFMINFASKQRPRPFPSDHQLACRALSRY